MLRRLLSLTVISGCLVLLTMAGCATQQTKPIVLGKLAWPPPPDTTRVEFVRSITTDKDLVDDTTFKENVINFLAGTKPIPNHIV